MIQRTNMKSIAPNLTCPANSQSFGVWPAICTCILILGSAASEAFADYRETIRPLLAKYCMDCHGAEEQNAQVRFDRVTGFSDDSQQLWTMVHEALVSGEMPPKGEPQPSAAEKRQILTWIIDQATQQVGQQTDKRVHTHLLVGPMVLRTHRHVVAIFELSERRFGMALTLVSEDDVFAGPLMLIRHQQAFAKHLGFQVEQGGLINGPREAIRPFSPCMILNFENLLEILSGL